MSQQPLEPEMPADNDCCGAACDPCIWDIYYQRLQAWQAHQHTHPSPANDTEEE